MTDLPLAPAVAFHDHDWVSPCCIHREHGMCTGVCPLCDSECLCVCHRWVMPIQGQPIVEH